MGERMGENRIRWQKGGRKGFLEESGGGCRKVENRRGRGTDQGGGGGLAEEEINRIQGRNRLSVLGETDLVGTLTEALTADVDTVLADQTSLVLADSAAAGALAVL